MASDFHCDLVNNDDGRIQRPSFAISTRETMRLSTSSKEQVSTADNMDVKEGSILPSIPQMHMTKDDVMDPEVDEHRPPMSVIVVSSPAEPDLHLGLPSGLSSRREARVTSSSSVFSTPFRLQPRSAMAVAKPGGDGAIRGRKRSAHTMSASKLGRDALLTTKPQPTICMPPMKLDMDSKPAASAVTPKRLPSSGSTPPRDTRRGLGRVDNTMVNFQCLSLQSPKRKGLSPPPRLCASPPQMTSGLPPSGSTSSSSSAATAAQRPAMVPGSVGSFQSLAVSSGTQPRSSFTPLYNSASPGGSMRSIGSGSIGSNTRMNFATKAAAQSPSMQSNCGSTKSSPKIAPLTVLQDRGAKLPSRGDGSRLPPLAGGGMSSLFLSMDSDNSDPESPTDYEDKLRPPRTVHCRRPSLDSISTVQNSVLSPMPRPSPMRSHSAFSSPASASGAPKASTPRSKQRRLDEHASPSHRTPRTPRTPLPRVTLTPRSTCSRRSRQGGQGLPRFPSPSDVDMDVTSPFLNSAAAATLRDVSPTYEPSGVPIPPRRSLRSSFPASSNSLALSADGSTNEHGSTGLKKAPLPMLDLSAKSPKAKASGESELSGGSFMGIQTMSLLNSSRTGGILQAMMEEANGGMNGDLGSVSDIDEDEGFILASPSAIEEERFASCQPARQRRRRSCDRFNNHTTARDSPSLSPNASNSNLAGMNYVTSNTSLFGMDIAHPTESAPAASTDGRAPKLPTGMKMSKSSSLGSDPGMFLTGPQDLHTLKRKSDASYDSIGLALEGACGDGGRDLVTPPPIPTPKTPPPLSPKEGFFMPVVMPEGPVDVVARRQAASVCVAGRDRKSVTMAIARMASEAQGHAESSPVL